MSRGRKDEEARLKALESYRVLDTPPERSYDVIAKLAAQLCNTPVALVSLVDETRQWFKSCVGLSVTETPREFAFCAHTMMNTEVFIIPDTQLDDRFRANPLVTADPHIRFYAGAPLRTPDGHGLGSLCVIDKQPSHLDEMQVDALSGMAKLVVDLLELRRVSADLASALDRVKNLSDLVPMCAWCRRIRDSQEYWVRVEKYLSETGRTVTHGICEACASTLLSNTEDDGAKLGT